MGASFATGLPGLGVRNGEGAAELHTDGAGKLEEQSLEHVGFAGDHGAGFLQLLLQLRGRFPAPRHQDRGQVSRW